MKQNIAVDPSLEIISLMKKDMNKGMLFKDIMKKYNVGRKLVSDIYSDVKYYHIEPFINLLCISDAKKSQRYQINREKAFAIHGHKCSKCDGTSGLRIDIINKNLYKWVYPSTIFNRAINPEWEEFVRIECRLICSSCRSLIDENDDIDISSDRIIVSRKLFETYKEASTLFAQANAYRVKIEKQNEDLMKENIAYKQRLEYFIHNMPSSNIKYHSDEPEYDKRTTHAIKLYKKGVPVKRIASELNVSRTTVYNLFRSVNFSL